jgi:S1-C subfamily serine protease
MLLAPAPKPADPDFIPNDYATGVVVDRRGLVLTAYHVLGEESDYYVSTFDRRVYRARLTAADPRSDLAVLAPEEESLPRPGALDLVPINLGDSAGIRKGQIVVCLGNPFAIARDGQASASWGIIANLARKAPPNTEEPEQGKPTIHHYGTLIQTDAKLNLGTSGGPLLNLKGEMVGLTTSIPAVPGYDDAAGYAIPVDATFRRVLEALKQGREVEYGFLGIRLRSLPPQELGEGIQGTRVERVLEGMPAARHGVLAGDVVTSVNGNPIRDPDSLVLEVSKLPVDAVVRLGVLRNRSKLDLDVELTKYRVAGKKVVSAPSLGWRGMRIDYLSAVHDVLPAGPAGAAGATEAVAVIEVEKGTPAWDAGLRAGILVSHVERTPVRTPKQFRAAVSSRPGPVRLQVAGETGGVAPRTITVPGA